ncbi:rhamnan synthesis F family protein [Yoonia tamlensis]|nr:rhamnan synthesis F family protein [Yoonia tamlensis]
MVANGGLHDSGRKSVIAHVWRLLERPNFGYDFGGFRDAIHFLQRQQISPQNLVLMNDSVWFPMWTQSDVVERLENAEYDATGLLFHVPTRNEYPDKKFTPFQVKKRAEHIESYVTMVPGKTFEHPAFKRFWDTYEQTDSKFLTIKRGEVGFSRALGDAGLTVGALSRRKSFLDALQGCSDGFIEQTLRYAAYSDQVFAQECAALLAAPRDEIWRKRALDHIGRVVKTRRFNASFCWATEQIFQTSFVKKNTDRLFQVGRIRFLDAVENGDMQCDNAEALAELRLVVAADRDELPKKAWRPH